MVPFRIVGRTLVVLSLTILLTQTSRVDAQTFSRPTASSNSPSYGYSSSSVTTAVTAAEQTCVIYALDALGDDPELCKWIAETIPEVIEPGTWNQQGKTCLRYYGPKRVLVVYHTPAVHAKVNHFLSNMKKSIPEEKEGRLSAGKTAARNPMVVPVDYREPALIKAKTSIPTAEQHYPYPVPAPAKAPKHLFHFIIRYEGEGIVDDNVAKAIKYGTDKKEEKEEKKAESSAEKPADKPTTSAPEVVSTAPTLATPATSSGVSLPKEKDKDDKELVPPPSTISEGDDKDDKNNP